MSDYELNKGRLIPVQGSIPDLVRSLVDEKELGLQSYEDWFRDNCSEYGYQYLLGQFYKSEMAIDGENSLDICDVAVDDSGVITFTTLHYNGGAHWTEVVADGVKKLQKEKAGEFGRCLSS